ncbi:MAG: hypothetical protein IT463_11405 [Planctomycetes bacterium]|nr:hypothetical protein [Planctomycetota bacterium]
MFRVALLGACVAATPLAAQSFEAPTRIKAGEKFAGHELGGRDRLYPSPALHDLDGDGKREIVIGDLFGGLTYLSPTKDGWGEEKVLNGADGKPLKFNNW